MSQNEVKINYLLKTLFVFFLFSSYNTTFSQESDSLRNVHYKINYLESERYFKEIKENDEYYFGEGIVKIENNDFGEAILKAKERARDNLAKSIKVRVTSTVKKIISSKSIELGNKSEEQINESIDIQSGSYTDQLLTELKESEYKIDYPTRNHVTIMLYIKKSLYNSIVEKDIEAKKTLIRNQILNGNKKYVAKHYVSAVRDWLLANYYLKENFGNLPVEDDIENTGFKREISTYINHKITSFFSGIKLQRISNKLYFDVKGQLNGKPTIFAEFEDEYGNATIIKDLPMKTNFVDGEGKIRSKIISDIYGKINLKIDDINPKYKNVIIRASIDESQFEGLDNFSNLSFAYIDLEFSKMKTVALAVTFINGGVYSSPDELKNKIQSYLLKKGLQVVSTEIKKRNIADEDIMLINKTNADYLIYAFAESNGDSKVGGYDNMFISSSSGATSIYQLPQGNIISSNEIESAKGYGVSASSAGWSGYSKLKNKIISEIEKMAEYLK